MPEQLGLAEPNDGLITQKTPLSLLFNDPSGLYQRTRLDSTLRYLLRTPIQKISATLNEEFRERFLSPSNGADLGALILQMGRDHGLAGYTKWRESCGLTLPKNFADLKNIWESEIDLKNEENTTDIIAQMEKIFIHVDDIDLFIGGLAEQPLKGALVGPTFACILGIQFEKV